MNLLKNIGLLALLYKLGPAFIKLFKSAKVIKASLATGSMAAYSYLFTWEFAVILLISIVFHEYGHIQGMKKCGIKTKGIYLIPFFGGAAVPEDRFSTRRDETYVSLMGPWYGFILLIPFFIGGLYWDWSLLLGLASFMALINLFNLFPINPLDGGRVLKSIAFSIHSKFGFIILGLGLIFSILLVYYLKLYLLVFIFILGSLELLFEYREYKKQQQGIKVYDFKKMSKKEIIQYGTYYLTLIGLFIFVIFYIGEQYPEASIALNLIKDS